MKNLLSSTERARNNRLRELYSQKEKVSQNQNKGVNKGNEPTNLTPTQIEELQREHLRKQEQLRMELDAMNEDFSYGLGLLIN